MVFKKFFKNLEIEKCLHGKTHNNKGIYALIGKHCPKGIYAGFTVLEINVASTVTIVNNGIVWVLAKLGAVLGTSSIDYCKNVTRHEQERITKAYTSYTRSIW